MEPVAVTVCATGTFPGTITVTSGTLATEAAGAGLGPNIRQATKPTTASASRINSGFTQPRRVDAVPVASGKA